MFGLQRCSQIRVKMFKTATFLFLFVHVVLGDSGAHIINDCVNPGNNPTFLYDQEVSKPGAFLHTQEETIRIPENGFSPKPITCITVTNLDSDANAGYPKIKAGGVGFNYVTIHLESQWGKGYDFKIDVYYDNS